MTLGGRTQAPLETFMGKIYTINEEDLKKRSLEIFNSAASRGVDVLYILEDGSIHAPTIEILTKSVVVGRMYRNKGIKAMALSDSNIGNALCAAEILRAHRQLRTNPPSYKEYQYFLRGLRPIDYSIFTFLRDTVFRGRKTNIPGETDRILTWKEGIVNAIFMRRFPHCQIFMREDNLIITCSTNIELCRTGFSDIFPSILQDLEPEVSMP